MPSLSLRLTLLRDISTAPVMATAKQEQPEQKIKALSLFAVIRTSHLIKGVSVQCTI